MPPSDEQTRPVLEMTIGLPARSGAPIPVRAAPVPGIGSVKVPAAGMIRHADVPEVVHERVVTSRREAAEAEPDTARIAGMESVHARASFTTPPVWNAS